MRDSKSIREGALKAGHLVLRRAGLAPEMRAAARLASTMPAVLSTVDSLDVLVLSMRDWSIHVQIEAMLGHALELRGAKVHYLTCGGGHEICDRVNTWEGPPVPCRSCTRYVENSLSAHGRTPIALSDMSAAEPWPELDDMSLDELRLVAFDGLELGSIVEVPVKWFLLADSLGNDPIGAHTFRAFLRVARTIAVQVERALDQIQPDRVLMLNGLFLFEAIASASCRRRGVAVATYERGFVIDTFLFDGQNPAGLSDLSTVWPKWSDRELTAAEEGSLDEYLDDRRHGRRTADEYWRDVSFTGLERASTGSRAVLFTNLVWDSAVVGQDIAFSSIVDWLSATVDVFESRPDDELIIRIHPAEEKLSGRESRERMLDALRAVRPVLPSNVRVIEAGDPMSSYVLMEQADIGLVYSSTTGLEMVLAGKPVVVAAQTHYRGKGFTIDASSAESYGRDVSAALDDPLRYAPDTARARRYAYLFFFRAPYQGLGVTEHVRGLARVTATDASELMPGSSIDLDRFCDAFLGDFDFSTSP
jgi:Capsule polysaccharide biosynthesis protein